MEDTIKLPVSNQYGYYEIRLESIGGLGANLTGKILGELGAIGLDLNSCSFASYGSEKKGTPIKSFIRWCDKEQDIRITTPIEKPHILGIFHETLAGKVAVTAGICEEGHVVVNTDKTPDEIRDLLELCGGTVYCVDALKIALEEKTRVNMVMLGAIAKASGFIPLDVLNKIVEESIGKKYPAALEGNLKGIKRGYSEIEIKKFEDKKYPYVEYKDVEYEWGWKNAPIGGVNPNIGSMISNDMTASREGYVPVFHKEKCINCGLCDMTCPEFTFQFERGEYKGKEAMVNQGIDYHHCKGCLRCVEVCPTAALTSELEREVDVASMHKRDKDLVVSRMVFEELGSNVIVDEESSFVNGVEDIEGEER